MSDPNPPPEKSTAKEDGGGQNPTEPEPFQQHKERISAAMAMASGGLESFRGHFMPSKEGGNNNKMDQSSSSSSSCYQPDSPPFLTPAARQRRAGNAPRVPVQGPQQQQNQPKGGQKRPTDRPSDLPSKIAKSGCSTTSPHHQHPVSPVIGDDFNKICYDPKKVELVRETLEIDNDAAELILMEYDWNVQLALERTFEKAASGVEAVPDVPGQRGSSAGQSSASQDRTSSTNSPACAGGAPAMGLAKLYEELRWTAFEMFLQNLATQWKGEVSQDAEKDREVTEMLAEFLGVAGTAHFSATSQEFLLEKISFEFNARVDSVPQQTRSSEKPAPKPAPKKQSGGGGVKATFEDILVIDSLTCYLPDATSPGGAQGLAGKNSNERHLELCSVGDFSVEGMAQLLTFLKLDKVTAVHLCHLLLLCIVVTLAYMNADCSAPLASKQPEQQQRPTGTFLQQYPLAKDPRNWWLYSLTRKPAALFHAQVVSLT